MHYELLYTINQACPYPPDPPFHVQSKPIGVIRLPRLLLIKPEYSLFQLKSFLTNGEQYKINGQIFCITYLSIPQK